MAYTDLKVQTAALGLRASLLRKDPVSVQAEEIPKFHKLLEAVILECSPENIEFCKAWLVHHVVVAPGRISALGKYLVALTTSFRSKANEPLVAKAEGKVEKPTFNRRQIHVLYLLNDVLHHTQKHNSTDFMLFLTFVNNILPNLNDVLKQTASCDSKKFPKHHRRLNDVIQIWASNKYFKDEDVSEIRRVVQEAEATKDPASKDADGKAIKDPPYALPTSHGNPATPWYDLPAANLLPLIRPGRRSIKPRDVKPLRFPDGSASESLVTAVKNFLKDANAPEQKSNFDGVFYGSVRQFDELGQPLIQDDAAGKFVPKETYYGWSIAFAEKMREQRRDAAAKKTASPAARRYSETSSAPHNNYSPNKRPRYSSSSDDSRGRPSYGLGRHSTQLHRPPQDYDHRSRSNSRSPPDSHGNSFVPRAEQHPPTQISYPRPPPLNASNSSVFPARPNPPFITPTDQINPPFPMTMPPPPPPPPTAPYRTHADNGMPPPPSWHGNASWPPAMPDWQHNWAQNAMAPPPPPPHPSYGGGNGYRGGRGGGRGGWRGSGHWGSGGSGQGWNQSGYRGRGGPSW